MRRKRRVNWCTVCDQEHCGCRNKTGKCQCLPKVRKIVAKYI